MTFRKVTTRTRQVYLAHRNLSGVQKPKILFTENNVVRSPYPDIEVPNITITEHVWMNMERWADKTALVCGITNRSYTYHQLYKFSRNFAANLRKKIHITDGDVIHVMLHNSPEYAIVVLGILQAGAVLTTCNPTYTKYELQRHLVEAKPTLIIGSSATITTIKASFIITNKKLPIITVKEKKEILPEGTISFREMIEDTDHCVLKEVKRKPDDLSILPYSSGTTGLPKGVEISSRNIVTNYLQQDVEEVKQYKDTTSSHQETIMAVLPFCHIYGLSLIMLHKLSVGAKLISLPKFKPNTFLAALKEHKVSLLYAAPPMGSHADVKKEHLISVDKVVNGAAPVSKHDIDKMLDKTQSNTRFIQVYGSTEALLVTSTVSSNDDFTSSGCALPNTQLKIVDINSCTLGPNEVGELLIQGPQIMKGYRNNQTATKESTTEDGWFRSGDLAKIDNDGTLTIVDRLKEIIKVKGYQVPPVELENILKEHPAVFDVGVIGVPDSKLGQSPKAFIVLKGGRKIDKNEIIKFVGQRVVDYKAVRDVMFLKELPKSPSGKLLRRVLKEKYCD